MAAKKRKNEATPPRYSESEEARRARGSATVISVRLSSEARISVQGIAARLGVSRNAVFEEIALRLDVVKGVLVMRPEA